MRPNKTNCDSNFHPFIDAVEADNIHDALSFRVVNEAFIHSIPESKQFFRYQPEKWTIKEVLAHLVDSEKYFNHEIIRIGDLENMKLLASSEKIFPKANELSLNEILDHFNQARTDCAHIFESISPSTVEKQGVVVGRKVDLLSLGFINAGHEIHHRRILEERYLDKL